MPAKTSEATFPLFLSGAMVLVLVGLCYVVLPESYCFFNPWIDTRTAAGFTEERFLTVKPGMTEETLTKLLGAPLDRHARKDGSARWYYTRDGKCGWYDWAWFGREVDLRDGKVVATRSIVYRD